MSGKQPQPVPVPTLELAASVRKLTRDQLIAVAQVFAGYNIDACREAIEYAVQRHPEKKEGT